MNVGSLSGRAPRVRPLPCTANAGRLALLAGAIASGAALAASTPRNVAVELRAAAAPDTAWVEITPLQPDLPSQFHAWPKGRRHLKLTLKPVASMVCTGGEGLAVECTRIVVATSGQSVPAAYRPGRTLVGRCRRGDESVVGVRVAVVPEVLSGNRSFTLPLQRTRHALQRHVFTDGQGRFSLPPLAPGTYRLELLPPGGRIHHTPPFVMEGPDGAARARTPLPALDLGDVVVPAGLSLAVLVVDQGGVPVPGARVTASQPTDSTEGRYFQSQTGADGWVALTGLEAGAVTLGCTAAGYHPGQGAFEAVPTSVECRVEALAGARGALVDESGAAVAQATVSVRGYRLVTGGVTALRVAASAAGYASTRVTLAVAEDGRLPRIVLSQGGRIRVAAWDEDADAPCSACRVLVHGANAAGVAVTTDGDGLALTDVLPSGRYVVSLEKVRSVGSVVEMQGGGSATACEVTDGGTVDVRLGRRLERIRVAFDPGVPSGWVLTTASRSAGGTLRAEVDGSFIVRKPEAEAVSLRLGDGQGTTVDVGTLAAEEHRPSLTVPLPRTRLAGVLVRGQGPLAFTPLRLTATGGVHAWARTDAVGAFVLPFVRPGAYVLDVDGQPVRPLVVTADGLTDVGTLEVGGR